MKLSRRESMNESLEPHDSGDASKNARGEAAPVSAAACARFRRDLSGKTFDSCVCGFAKRDHDAKEPTRGASEELTAKLRGVASPLRRSAGGAASSSPPPPLLTLEDPAAAAFPPSPVEDDSDGEGTEIYFCGRPAMLPCAPACSGLWVS